MNTHSTFYIPGYHFPRSHAPTPQFFDDAGRRDTNVVHEKLHHLLPPNHHQRRKHHNTTSKHKGRPKPTKTGAQPLTYSNLLNHLTSDPNNSFQPIPPVAQPLDDTMFPIEPPSPTKSARPSLPSRTSTVFFSAASQPPFSNKNRQTSFSSA